jgi:hypothetical protein
MHRNRIPLRVVGVDICILLWRIRCWRSCHAAKVSDGKLARMDYLIAILPSDSSFVIALRLTLL